MYDDLFTTNDMLVFQKMLKKNNQTITIAESCTGGLISSMITEISGSSQIFRGSVVTYSNEIKEQELHVNKETIMKYGAVSYEVVKEMLCGVLKKFNSNYAIAVSGIAGPNGGTDDKPIGTVVIGVMNDTGDQYIQVFHFNGNRQEVQIQSAKMALKLNFEILLKKP